MSTLADITKYRIVPVVVCSDASRADALGNGLVAGGLPVAEVTFRTDAAAEVIAALAARGDMVVGAGTVVSPAQVDLAVQAGATFIVSPGLDVATVERAQQHGMPIVPGAVTPSEIMTAMRLGLSAVKFFPAGTFGGAAAIAALSAPFSGLQFLPTGGVSLANLADYLSLASVPAVGGSWMVPADAVDSGDAARIAELSAAAVGAASSVGPKN